MINQFFLNNTSSKLDAGIGSGTLVMSVPAGNGDLFGASFPLKGVIQEFDTLGRVTKREFIRITGGTDDIFNIVRAVEPCPASWDATTQTQTAFSFSDQAIVSIIFSADDYEAFKDEINGKMDVVGGLGTGYGANKTKYIDPTTGNEVAKNTSQVSSLGDTDLMFGRDTAGDEKRIPFSVLKNQLGSAGKYVRTVQMGETIAGSSLQSLTATSLFALQTSAFTYPGNTHNTPDGAFNTNGGDTGYVNSGTAGTRTLSISSLVYQIKVTKIQFSFYTQYGTNAGMTIVGIKQDGTEVTIWTRGTSFGAGTFAVSADITDTNFFIGFKINYVEVGNGTTTINNVVFDLQYTPPSIYAVSIIDTITYSGSLTASSGSAVKRGIRVQCPYAGTLRNVKSSKASSSSSATIQIRDESDALVKEVAVASGQSIADMNYTFTAGQIFRIVMNDSANFTSSNDYLAIGTYQTFFPYLLTGTTNNVTDNTNAFGFDQIDIDFGGKAFRSRADRAIELPFAVFSGFVTAPISAGATVDLNENDGTYVTGFSSLTKNSPYYVSNVAGVISSTRGTIYSTIGVAKDTTSILIDRDGIGMKGSSSSSSTTSYGGDINITSRGVVSVATLSGTGQVFWAPPGSNTFTALPSLEIGNRVLPGRYRAYGGTSGSSSITILA